MSDHADCPATSSRVSGQPQRRLYGQTSNTDDVIQTAGGSWQTTNAVDRKCQKSACSTPSDVLELWTADIYAQLCRACAALAEECPASAVRHAVGVSDHGRTCVETHPFCGALSQRGIVRPRLMDAGNNNNNNRFI